MYMYLYIHVLTTCRDTTACITVWRIVPRLVCGQTSQTLWTSCTSSWTYTYMYIYINRELLGAYQCMCENICHWPCLFGLHGTSRFMLWYNHTMGIHMYTYVQARMQQMTCVKTQCVLWIVLWGLQFKERVPGLHCSNPNSLDHVLLTVNNWQSISSFLFLFCSMVFWSDCDWVANRQ